MTDTAAKAGASAWIEKLRAAPAFADVAPDDLARLARVATPLAVADEETVFARADPAPSVYLVLAGSVRIGTLSSSGKRITVEIFQRDDLFGEVAAIDEGARSADAAAMGRVELLALPVATFREVLTHSAPLANNLLRLATARLRRTYSLLEDASLRTIEQRLAKQVLYLVKLGATGDVRVRLSVQMHQDELADLLGITTRSIINVLNKWRGEDLVSFDGRTARLTILDIGRFRALTEE
jgi:CRP-like cAMP-binding protein